MLSYMGNMENTDIEEQFKVWQTQIGDYVNVDSASVSGGKLQWITVENLDEVYSEELSIIKWSDIEKKGYRGSVDGVLLSVKKNEHTVWMYLLSPDYGLIKSVRSLILLIENGMGFVITTLR